MKTGLKLKLFLYRFFSTGIGKVFLRLSSSGVTVKDLGNNKKQENPKHPFLVIITTDTESGYVDKDERRIWQNEKPEAFIGYYYGLRNLTDVFDKHKIKTTFFLSTQCFSSRGNEYNKIKKEISKTIKKEHEIGLHLHPDSDFAIQEKLSKKFDATSAFFYTYEEKLGIIKTAKELIEKHLGKNIAKKLVSFRWGNWALDTGGVKALQNVKFKIDSSATPGIKGHLNDTMKYDWSKVNRHYPWKLSARDYQAINHNNSKILEIPIATFDFFGIRLRADPINSILLNKAFIEYYRKADRSKKPFPFVVMTHSSEATYNDGKYTKALEDLDRFISLAKKSDDVEFVTLREAYERLKI
jgi:peptidoglycan/xylan/chitin deacetylase (PgdA/CDA1 family)